MIGRPELEISQGVIEAAWAEFPSPIEIDEQDAGAMRRLIKSILCALSAQMGLMTQAPAAERDPAAEPVGLLDVTPEMINVGADLLSDLSDTLPPDWLAERVYRAMSTVQNRGGQPRNSKPTSSCQNS